MHTKNYNKRKIINDPVHGFIIIPNELIYDLIQHRYFQRLRRIKQLGLSHLVYPGANHTRFHHALGAMHLMGKAIDVLKSKGIVISEEEKNGAEIAILLHDIGHGPFSHTLEKTLLKSIHHEEMSLLFMKELNKQFSGKLDIAIDIFTDKYQKKFLHQLVSSQLDMDRLDYLSRDSYFTGVTEGLIGSDRIIAMLNVAKGELVIEEKGIYSIESFIGARRLMYWQVYMHKTVVSSEYMLISILTRAKQLISTGLELFASPSLKYFLEKEVSFKDFENNQIVLDHFALVDDTDIITSIKVWQSCDDKILSLLCNSLISRKLFKTEISREPYNDEKLEKVRKHIQEKLELNDEELSYFIQSEKLVNRAYDEEYEQINILMKNGIFMDIAKASDNLNISALSTPVEKYALCLVNVD